MIKPIVFVAAMAASASAAAYNAPSVEDVAAYTDRAGLYIRSGLSPEQVALSLRNWFGKSYFVTLDRGWDGGIDIQVVIGEGNEITYVQTIATINAAPTTSQGK